MALLLEELGWPDVQEYLGRDDRLILVVESARNGKTEALQEVQTA